MCHLRVHNFPINQVGADDEEDNFLFRSHFARQAMHGRTLCRYWRRRWRRKEDGFVSLLQARDHSLHFVRGQKQSLCLCIPWQARPPAESACKLATVKSFRSRCSRAACARGALHDTLVGWLLVALVWHHNNNNNNSNEERTLCAQIYTQNNVKDMLKQTPGRAF